MQAHLIDPANQSVTTVELPDSKDRLTAIYRHLQCDTFDVATLPNGDTIYVDDEGLLRPLQHFIAIRGMPEPFAGRGLVMGTDSRGHSINPTISLAELTRRVKFIELINKDVVMVRDARNPQQERVLPLKLILRTLAQEAAE